NYAQAKKAADDLTAHVGPQVAHMPMLEGFMPTPLMVMVEFHRWDEILATPAPAESMPITSALNHFARGCALAGKGDIAAAKDEHEKLIAKTKSLPSDAPFGPL